jgi:hypothetical protein
MSRYFIIKNKLYFYYWHSEFIIVTQGLEVIIHHCDHIGEQLLHSSITVEHPDIASHACVVWVDQLTSWAQQPDIVTFQVQLTIQLLVLQLWLSIGFESKQVSQLQVTVLVWVHHQQVSEQVHHIHVDHVFFVQEFQLWVYQLLQLTTLHVHQDDQFHVCVHVQFVIVHDCELAEQVFHDDV